MPKAKLLKRMRRLEKELKQEAQSSNLDLIQELATTRAGIPAELLRQYDRLKRKISNPIVRLENGVCQGCYMSTSLGVALVAKAHRGIYICEHCGRLLYVDFDEPSRKTNDKKDEK